MEDWIVEHWYIRHVRSMKSYVPTGVHVFEVTLPSEQEKGFWSFDLGFIPNTTWQFFSAFSIQAIAIEVMRLRNTLNFKPYFFFSILRQTKQI